VSLSLSVVIPAYNGAKLLNDNLPHLNQSLKEAKIDYEIIIVDDCSEKILQINQDKTEVVRLAKNSGFAHACNTGAKLAQYSKILFLNTDVKVTPEFIEPLLKHFSSRDVFAVSPRILIPAENYFDEAITTAKLRGSNLILKIGTTKQYNYPLEILYACGAALLVDKDKFVELGGFDELYKPYYSEDLDLSYQAWKRGFRVIYEPLSTVYHLHGTTIKSVSKSNQIKKINMRNQYLFRWKNFTDPGLVLLMILEAITVKLINPNPIEWRAFLGALLKLGQVIKRRKRLKKLYRLKDKEILEKFKHLL